MPIATVNNTKIYYEQHGAGEPLFLITGYGADHLAWTNVLDPLVAAGYQVIILSNRDCGPSQQVDHAYTVVDMANDAAALLDYLKIKKAHIVGHSMGGAIAQELVLHHPDKVKKLMLYATTAKFDPRCCYILKQRIHLLQTDMPPEDRFRVIDLPWCFSFNFLSNEETIATTLKLAKAAPYPMPLEAYKRQLVALANHDTSDRLKNIAAETLVLALEEDILTPPAEGKLVADSIPNARYLEVKYHAHCFHLEAPQEFVKIATDFLSKMKPRI